MVCAGRESEGLRLFNEIVQIGLDWDPNSRLVGWTAVCAMRYHGALLFAEGEETWSGDTVRDVLRH